MNNVSMNAGSRLALSVAGFLIACSASAADTKDNVDPTTTVRQNGETVTGGPAYWTGTNSAVISVTITAPPSHSSPFANTGSVGWGGGGAAGSGGGIGGSPGSTAANQGQKGANQQTPCTATPNPVIISEGTKFNVEKDFVAPHAAYPISLIRNYSSAMGFAGIFGSGWRSTFDPSLSFTLTSGGYCTASPGTSCMTPTTAVSAVGAIGTDGSVTTYNLNSSTGQYVNGPFDATDWFIRNADGSWTRQSKIGASQTYNYNGFITSDLDAVGVGWLFNYTNGTLLASATHSNGQTFSFQFTNGHVTSITDPSNNAYQYSYTTGSDGAPHLTGVTQPNGHTRTYFYENTSLPSALTGIAVDGNRYSTYTYTINGLTRVASSGLGDGSIEKDTFSYVLNKVFQQDVASTTITNAAGAVTTYSYDQQYSQAKLTQITAVWGDQLP